MADALADRAVEGRFDLGDLGAERAYRTEDESRLLVLNPLPFERTVNVEVPEFRAGGAPAGMLESFFPRNVPWGGPPASDVATVRVTVPGYGFAFAHPSALVEADDLIASGTLIENEFYRVEVDARTGRISTWFDKELGHDFADTSHLGGFGTYLHEMVDSAEGRDALFVNDFSDWDFGHWVKNPPFTREPATTVECSPARIEAGRAIIDVAITGRGLRRATCRISLPTLTRTLHVDWLLDKEPQTEPESVYILFPVRLDGHEYVVDLNGTPVRPNLDQVPGSVFDWYPTRRWTDVSDGMRGVTVASLDAPLMQLGGITTNTIGDTLEPERPALVSWALNNHWMVNFKASQEGLIPLRYRFTTHAGSCAYADANRFALEECVTPVVLRDYKPTGGRSGTLFNVPDVHGVESHLKVASFGDGVVVRFRNMTSDAVRVPLSPLRSHGSLTAVNVLEQPIDASDVETSAELLLPAFAERSIRIFRG